MASKIKDREVKTTRSVRIEPKKRDLITKHYGTFQKWADKMVEAEISKIKGVKVHAQSTKVELTAKEKAKFKKLVDEMF